jgi:hypothetical protein
MHVYACVYTLKGFSPLIRLIICIHVHVYAHKEKIFPAQQLVLLSYFCVHMNSIWCVYVCVCLCMSVCCVCVHVNIHTYLQCTFLCTRAYVYRPAYIPMEKKNLVYYLLSKFNFERR